MTQRGSGGGGGGRGRGVRVDLAQEDLAGNSSDGDLPHLADGGLLQVSDGGLPDGGLCQVSDGGLPQAVDGGLLHGGWPDGAGVNWPGLTGGFCATSGTALPTEKTIARRTQLTHQPRLASQGSLRPIDAFTLNQECYSSGEFSGKNI
jgi:hypothetical protein